MTENERILRDIIIDGNGTDYDESIPQSIFEEIQQYRAIGTVKGYERAIEVSKENYNLYREYKALLREYEAIGTIEEFKALKEKSVAKKPLCIPEDDTCIYYGYYCPCCNEPLSNTARMTRCFCGQKLDW